MIQKVKENKIDLDEPIIVIDSQSIKTNNRFEKSDMMDTKKIKGIKRSIAVDKYGNILSIDITNANEHDIRIGVRLIRACRQLNHTILPAK